MQAGCRRIEADIGRHGFLVEQVIEAAFIGDLMNEAAFLQRVKEIGLELGHGLRLFRAGLFGINACWILSRARLALFLKSALRRECLRNGGSER